MDRRSVFFDEWIKSLREQYKYVIRNNDQVTLPSLTAVLHDVGFTDDELAQLRIEATMHVDDVGADYVADMQVLEKAKAGQPHPAECTCPQCIPIDESQFDDEGQPLVHDDPEKETHETGHLFAVATIEATDELEPEEEPQTFEDSLEAVEELIEEDAIKDETDNEDTDEDKPKQISMF